MPPLAESQAAVAEARRLVREARDAVRTQDYEIAKKRAEIEALQRESEEPPIQQQDQLQFLLGQRQEMVDHWNRERLFANAALQSFIDGFTNPNDLFDTTIEANRAVALFPVRLETYFKRPDTPGGATQLLVRVYPDDIHLEAHEPALTDAEVQAGAAFWQALDEVDMDRADLQDPATDKSIPRQAWAQLIADVGGYERAGYVARATETGAPAAPLRSDDWRRRPEARTLPDRWLVLGFPENSAVPNAFPPTYGGLIPDPLPVAPLAALDQVTAATASQLFDDETRWLVRFDKAEEVGMGIRITLPNPPPQKIGVLMVLGIKASLQSEDTGIGDLTRDTAQRRLDELFLSHRYTKGLGTLPDGTPTNGGASERSGFTERPSTDATFDIEFRPDRDPTEPLFGFDGQLRLYNEELVHFAFGFDSFQAGRRPFHKVEHGNRLDDPHARALNFVLWRSTWGYHLDQMINEIIQPSSGRDEWTGNTVQNLLSLTDRTTPRFNYARNIYARRHFANYVRSGSTIPAIRIGSQPYGLLPITSWEDWRAVGFEQPAEAEDMSRRPWVLGESEAAWPTRTWDNAIVDFLRRIRDTYYSLGPANVTTVANSFTQERDAIIKLLGWSEINRALLVRQLSSLQHQTIWTWNDEFEPEDVDAPIVDHRALTERALIDLGLLHSPPIAGDWRPRARDLVTLANGNFDTGKLPPLYVTAPIVYDGPLSQTLPLSQQSTGGDYLTWLTNYASTTWRQVDQEGGSPFGGRTGGVPLLYSMLRHAYLLELAWHPIAYGGIGRFFISFFRSGQVHPPDDPPTQRHFWQQPFVHSDMGNFRGPTPADLTVTPSYLSLLYAAATEPSDTVSLPPGNQVAWIGDYLETIKNQVVVQHADPLSDAVRDLYAFVSDEGGFQNVLHPSFFTFFQYLETLKEQPTAVLDRNTRGAIDLASHRLDAWFTSYAHRRHWDGHFVRLFSGKTITPHIGGYGWVENLRMRPETTDPVEGTPRSLGHAFAPSPAHATTAAILRAAQIAHSRDAATENLLGVNLSSARVREAKYLLDGVRQGQPLGALLGYRFERDLHESSQQLGQQQLDQYILPLRTLCPLIANQLQQAPHPQLETSIEKVAANNVVDGLALARKARTGEIPWGSATPAPGLPALGSAPQIALAAAITRLERAIDSVADAVLAESVYQGVLGNPARQGGIFGALNRGENAIPEFEVLDTPRSGEAYTHRLLVALQNTTAATGWAPTPRALAEPRLNAWLGTLLPAPAAIFARVEFRNPANGQPGTTPSRDVTLAELGIAPLDLVYDSVTGLAPAETALGQRVLTFIDGLGLGIGEEAVLAFDLSGPTPLPMNFVADFDTVLTVADVLRKLVTAGRPLRVAETALANDGVDDPAPTGAPDLVELRARVTVLPNGGAYGQLTGIASTLANPASTLAELRTALLGAANFGVAGALPGLLLRPAGLTDPLSAEYVAAVEAATRLLAAAVLPDVQRRLAAFDALTEAFSSTPTPEPEDIVAHDLARLEALFGTGFRAVPLLTPNNAEEFPLAAAADTSLRLQRNDPRQVVTWLQRTSRTRKAIESFSDAMLFVEAVRGSDPLDLRVAQIPFVPPSSGGAESWIGLDFAGGARPEGDRLGLVLQNGSALNPANPFGGLVIDEWVEVVPADKTTAALTFHYDTPGSRPGNAVLFVTPPTPLPDQSGFVPVNLTTLYRAVLDARNLARMRMVDLPSLGKPNSDKLAPYLPATLHTTDTEVREIDTQFIRNTLEAEEP